MRTVVLRVVALATLLLLVLVAVLSIRTVQRLPDTLVYFVRSEENVFRLEPVARRVRADGTESQLRAAFGALVAGPNTTERSAGLSSAVPGSTELRSLRLDDGLLTVDLSGEFEQGGGTAQMQARLYQLFFTLTQPAEVSAVALEIEGQPVRVFSGEGIVVPRPWLRAEHPELPYW